MRAAKGDGEEDMTAAGGVGSGPSASSAFRLALFMAVETASEAAVVVEVTVLAATAAEDDGTAAGVGVAAFAKNALLGTRGAGGGVWD